MLNPFNAQNHLVGKTVENQSLKSLTVADTDENLIDEKKYTLIHFFSTWCSTCKFDHERIKSLKLGNTRLIGVLWQDNPLNVAKWVLDYPSVYHNIVFDPDEKVALNLGLSGIPATVLLDNTGKILFTHIGELKEEMIRDVIQPKLK